MRFRFRFGPWTRKKIILLGVACVVLAILSAPLWIDGVAHRAVVAAATSALGVESALGDIDIAIFSGSCTFRDLTIRNPAGFRDQPFMTIEKGEMFVDLGTLLDDEVIAPTLVLDGLVLNLEREGLKTNYGMISGHSKRFRARVGKSGKKFIIRKVVIRNVKVRYRVSVAGIGPQLPLEIDEIEITDVGGKGESAYLGDVIDIVLSGILQTVAKLPTKTLPNAIGSGLKAIGDLFK